MNNVFVHAEILQAKDVLSLLPCILLGGPATKTLSENGSFSTRAYRSWKYFAAAWNRAQA
jgi:hypothetical protein